MSQSAEPSQSPSGVFITFEGIDGAGKTTHMDTLEALLKSRALEVVRTREPGGTPLAEKLRALFLHDAMDALTESLLVFAGRRDHVTQVIQPALARGAWVLCDRFTDATFAYQGGGRGFDLNVLATLEAWVHGARQPDLTFLFDLPPQVAATRLPLRVNPTGSSLKTRLFLNGCGKPICNARRTSPAVSL